jgi:hypothetical protein
VFTRLGRLTSLTKDNQDTPILDFYPLHREALKKAKLLPKNVPTLQELHQQEDDRQRRAKKKEEETENKQDGRTCYFVIGHSRFWRKFNIVKIIQRLKYRFKLNFLRFSMAFRRFTNLREKI